MIHFKLRYGGHGGIGTKWEIHFDYAEMTIFADEFERTIMPHATTLWPVQITAFGPITQDRSGPAHRRYSVILQQSLPEALAGRILIELARGNMDVLLGTLRDAATYAADGPEP